MIAYTLIVDDVSGVQSQHIWSIYYDVRLKVDAFLLLQSQAQKLVKSANTIDAWNDSCYGQYVRFCDLSTFKKVTDSWTYYAITQSEGKKFHDQQQSLKKQWQTAEQHQKEMTKTSGIVATGVRSAAPFFLDWMDYMDKGGNPHRAYWTQGMTQGSRPATYMNPMFRGLYGTLILHYGTDPLLGFHQSTAYANLSHTSPLKPAEARASDSASRNLNAALTQFEAWTKAFRFMRKQIVLRFSHSDAIALCSVLQHRKDEFAASGTHCYRKTWSYQPIELDTKEYGPQGTAPTVFDVIDTSNLVDHLGSLNMLSATVALLAKQGSSVIRTEMLVPKEEDGSISAKAMLCGNLPDVALLLGLRPVHFYSEASGTWTTDDVMTNFAKTLNPSRNIIVWRHTNAVKFAFKPKELARFVYNVYLEMFRNEKLSAVSLKRSRRSVPMMYTPERV
ncbi:hypothetical protein SLS60_009633 [Paraconiothyrium brasiliense]|uniref:DUF4470 domain-containing protein n=1 Tax=Paraconiothyrium brasiliense TaxID=300254 RepID=A0ABR3QUV2_9PLEO